MNSYLAYFLFGLRKYCGQFPEENDLPEFAKGMPPISQSAWGNALRLNYGRDDLKEEDVNLKSVFEFLETEKTTGIQYGFYPLSLDEKSVFPTGEKTDFESLVAGFQSEWDKLKKLKTIENFTDTLIFLSKKYFSQVGVSLEMPYISLHEHLKTTAALADCLERSGNQKVLLAGAGLDNIQEFCYDIVSSKAAKSLKGRSFYLQMLLDTLQHEIIRHPKIDVCLGHVIYARGGKMYLLLPDTPDCKNVLQILSRNLKEKFWQHFKSSLYGFLEFDEVSISESNAPVQAWPRLEKKIRTTKNRRLLDLFNPGNFKALFDPIPEGGTKLDTSEEGKGSKIGKKMCRVTGEIIEKPGAANLLEEDHNTGQKIWVTEFVKFQAALAEGIRDTDQYFWLQAKHGKRVEKAFFTGSDTFVSLPDHGALGKNWNTRRSDFQKEKQWSINKPLGFLIEQPEEMSYGFVFYGGNEQATTIENGMERVKFFHELAGLESDADKGKGFHRLGVCRMDVDRMGDMAKKATTSFALNASFSARLDLFLSGYINEIRNSKEDYREFLNILFAGGDDLLIVGRWDLVIDFARDLQQGFQKFIGGDFLTLSGGMAMVTPKFPIAKAVEMAGKAEDEAKKHGNAFALLGEVVLWKDEFDFVQSFSKKLEAWLADEQSGISSSFIFKIYQFNRLKAAAEPHWRWLSAWYFQQAEKDNSRSCKIFDSLKKFVFTDKWTFENEPEVTFPNRALPLLALAGKITDLKTRKNSKSDKI